MGGGKRKYRALTPAQIEWAYEKWCLGYTLAQIAEALEVSSRVGLKRAPSNLCFVCNEEGLMHNLPLNLFGSVLYGFHIHGNPIVGNIVFMREGIVDGEPDFVELTDEDIAWIKKLAREVSGGVIREVEAR